MPFSRYREIIPDWDSFEASRYIPEPITIRVRRGKVSADDLLPRLAAQGFALEPVSGVPDFFRVIEGPGSIAQTLEHWLGHFHIQQAVMALPSLALSPSAGERVLDLCAAPGGKTAHMAELMGDEGALVAVDPKEKRLRALLANIYRLGHSNVIVVAGDGRQLPLSANFDRVLVDAPCSAEGTFRRQEGKVPKRSASFVTHVTGAQEALLRRGIALTRPGGTLLYSTCTFAPEENEAIVSRVLADSPISVEEIPLDLPHSEGLGGWDDKTFHPDLKKAWRIYPHQMNAGGLFMVLLRRGADPEGSAQMEPKISRGARGWEPIPAGFPGEDQKAAESRIARSVRELESVFGFHSGERDRIGWMVRRENIWAQTAGEWPIPAWEEEEGGPRWRVVSLGLRALRDRGSTEIGTATPSSAFLARWGRWLGTDRQVKLSDDELVSLLTLRTLPTYGIRAGAVALIWQGMVLGRGMVRASGEMVSEIPAAQTARLLEILSRQGDIDLGQPSSRRERTRR